jgi:hypothetical protein
VAAGKGGVCCCQEGLDRLLLFGRPWQTHRAHPSAEPRLLCCCRTTTLAGKAHTDQD